MGGPDVTNLPSEAPVDELRYFIDVYVDNFIPLAIALSQKQLAHVAAAVMHGIHDVFPTHPAPAQDPISYKKLCKKDRQWALNKDLLGFIFNGGPGHKTMQLEQPKWEFLLAVLHRWLRSSAHMHTGVPLAEFESVIQKLRHAFMAIPCGRGLLTPCNKVLSLHPPIIYLHWNTALRQTITDCWTLVREATTHPTPCRELVMGEPAFVGIKDASLHGVGGIIVGHRRACLPTIF
jgi:hypothetical protein